MRSRIPGLVAAAVFLAACGPKPQTIPEPSPVPETAAPSTLETRATWTISPIAREVTYQATEHLVILDRTSAVHADTSHQTVQFTISPNLKTPWEKFSIRITGMRGPASQLPDDAGLPLSATGTWTDSKLTTELDNSPACGKAAATAVTAAIPVLIQPPHTLSIGTEWKDSSVSIGCAGTIPLKAITQRTYRVTGEASAGQQKGITIEETETTELSGEGADGQHYVRINGQGTGKGQLVIDPRDGTVLQIRTDSQNQISITASGRSQVFEQQLKKEISRTN